MIPSSIRDAHTLEEGLEEGLEEHHSFNCCMSCRFFNRREARCHRRSPIAIDWPEVEETDWCGDHEPGEYKEPRR